MCYELGSIPLILKLWELKYKLEKTSNYKIHIIWIIVHIPDPQSEYHMRPSLAKDFTERNGSEIATVVSPLVDFVKSQTGSF